MTEETARLDALTASFVAGDGTRAQILFDAGGRVILWNSGAEHMFALKAAAAIGQPVERFLPDSDQAAGAQHTLFQRAEAAPLDEERWLVRADGSEFLGHIMLAALNDAGGMRAYGLAIEDITDRRAAEIALTRKELHLRSILATVPDAMIVIDEHGQIQSFSAAAERMFGYAAMEVMGRNIGLLMPESDQRRHDDYVAHYCRTGERRIIGRGRIVVGRKRDGTEFPIDLSVGEARTDDGHRLFTGFIRDLTEQQANELQLKHLQSELIHISRVSAMGTMASTLAHEINQPLTAIANYMEASEGLIDDSSPNAALLHEAVSESGREALRAGGIVRRLREFVARGEVERGVESLPRLIDEASRLALVGARERGVRAFFDLDPAAELVLVDRIQIQQVIVNLIRNAVEALEGQVVRDITVSSQKMGAELVRVSVADTGHGIAPEIRPRLFDAFNTSKETGMGLGLSICRTIVESHGGRIWAEDRPEGGTVFNFTLMSGGTEE